MQTKASHHSEQGLTLIETVVALIIFLIFLGIIIPFFSNQRITTLKNEIDAGAIAVSQQVLDNLRQLDAASLPSTGTTTTLPSGESLAVVSSMGRNYSARITYCAAAIYCTTNARHIKVQVKRHGKTVYTVETAYTRLQ